MEWLNRQIFFDQYGRINSYFTNSDLSANFDGPRKPTEAELKLLRPLKAKYPQWVPDAVFGPMPAPPVMPLFRTPEGIWRDFPNPGKWQAGIFSR